MQSHLRGKSSHALKIYVFSAVLFKYLKLFFTAVFFSVYNAVSEPAPDWLRNDLSQAALFICQIISFLARLTNSANVSELLQFPDLVLLLFFIYLRVFFLLLFRCANIQNQPSQKVSSHVQRKCIGFCLYMGNHRRS